MKINLAKKLEENSNKKISSIENFVKKYKTPIVAGGILALEGAVGYIGYEMNSSIKEAVIGMTIFTGLGGLLFSYALSAFDSTRNRIGYKHYDD